MKKPRITPFGLLMIAFLIMLALGIAIILLGQHPPRMTHSLHYTV